MPLIEEIGKVNSTKPQIGRQEGRRAGQYLNTASQEKAIARRIADLEKDNYQDGVKIDIPKITRGPHGQRVGATVNSRRVLASRKALNNHLDDDENSANIYKNAAVQASRYPVKKLCSICSYWSSIVCIRCGATLCSLGCSNTHDETRCVKVY